MRYWKLVLSSLLVALMVFGLSSPAFAQTARITVEPQITNIEVGDIFEVKIWIRDVNEANPMQAFRFCVTWDKILLDFNGHSVNLLTGWSVNIFKSGTTEEGLGYLSLESGADSASDTVWYDRYWETISFRCLGPGSTPINLPASVDPDDSAPLDTYVNGQFGSYEVNLIKGAANQHDNSGTFGNPVGGFLTSTSKLTLLAPYLGLVGLIAAVTSVVFIIRRRKD